MSELKKNEFIIDLGVVLDSIAMMLLKKNESYGDSALNPKRIFSKADSIEQIKVRIDDKLSRIQNGSSFENDNDLDDLLGYLVLLKMAMNRQRLESGMKEMLNDLVDYAKKSKEADMWDDIQKVTAPVPD